jgi:NTP pyrophosphatase (non-canonical NTP hydrolase)
MFDAQRRVGEFVARHDFHAPPAYRLLDVTAELGEAAANAAKSTDYGAEPEAIAVEVDELGDLLFALLAFADRVGIDAEAALDSAIAKYERRIENSGGVGSE